MHRRQILVTSALVGAACVLAATALAQPPGAGALGAAPQPKVATPAAPPTAKAGNGGGPQGGPQTLEEAFAACDMGAVLKLGGGNPQDAIRVLIGQGRMLDTAIERPTWTRISTGFALTYLENGERFDLAGPGGTGGYDVWFGGWAPPNIAALPDADALFGPALPVPTPLQRAATARGAAVVAELSLKAVDGMRAPDVAAAYYAARPEALQRRLAPQPSQAFYVRCTTPATPSGTPTICVRTPAWGTDGQEVRSAIALMDGDHPMDPAKFPGSASLPSVNDPLPPEVKIPAEVLRRRALPPNPAGPGRPREC